MKSRKKFYGLLFLLILLGLLLGGCTNLHIFRVPTSIVRGSSASGPNQWFTRVTLTDDAVDGTEFQFVAWLHVPTDWTLPWSRQYSFSGDFANTNLAQSPTAQVWIETPGNCHDYGGPAESGYKWRAFIGPVENLPVNRFDLNRVNLRGGLGIPLAEDLGAYDKVKVVVGTYYDSNLTGGPETFQCGGGSSSIIHIVDAP